MTALTKEPIFHPKDFIETSEGLMFAVVAPQTEENKVLCFLRYVREGSVWEKYATDEANNLLSRSYPEYLHYSKNMDARLHAVALERIIRHKQPRQALQTLLQTEQHDAVEQDLIQLSQLFQDHGIDLAQAGITGSLLVGTQTLDSDIDFVLYSRAVFQRCRTLVKDLIEQGHLQPLRHEDWVQSYQRRSCDLSFADYVWHESRKYNKALINGRKFDLNFIDLMADFAPQSFQKCGAIKLQSRVIDDSRAFDYPAEFRIAHEEIKSIVCFTATYTGQAFAGEMIEVSGFLEQSEQGEQRIVVGATREAEGEFIRVVHG